MYFDKSEWTLVGHIGVDAGLCWIGDPCYILHRDKLPETLGKNWDQFCDTLESYPLAKSFNHDLGHEGLGVVVSTGYGDGTYPVYVKYIDDRDWGKRVVGVYVDFLGEMEEEEYDDEDEEDEEDDDE
jgi:hypothetical protein